MRNTGTYEIDVLQNRVLAMAVDPHLASALNRYLASPLRVEIDEVTMEPTSQANLTALAGEIQRSLDDLGGAPPEQMAQRRGWEDGGLRVVWHARPRRDDEQADPVIVA
jgi:hypothetical protein